MTLLLICFMTMILTGCGTLPNGRRWGQDAFLPIDIDRVSCAAHDAFFDINTASASSYATLANRNIDSIVMHHTLRPAIKAENLFLALGVAWVRVEEQRHYPSDVLAGAALGQWLAVSQARTRLDLAIPEKAC